MPILRSAKVMPFSLVLVAASALSGCGFDTSAILAPDCNHKVQVDAELHVDPTDDRWIWAVDRQTGQAISLRIGGGYGVSQEPPAIVDATGRVIGRTGDLIVSGCRDIVQDAIQIDDSDLRSAS